MNRNLSIIIFIIRRDQVNFPDRPYFKQKQKNNITTFGQLAFFNLLFSTFLKKIRNMT